MPDGSFAGPIGSRVFLLREIDDDTEYRVVAPSRSSTDAVRKEEALEPIASTPPSAPSSAAAASAVAAALDPVNLSGIAAAPPVTGGSAVPDVDSLSPAAALADYFQLDVRLAPLFEQWARADAHFCQVCDRFRGLRVLRQEPFENLISFICSSNNNIPRITQMVNRLAELYGQPIADIDGQRFFTFPTPHELLRATEDELRAMAFGYRAKFIVGACRAVVERGGAAWLRSLRAQPRAAAQAALLSLLGVGAKVADCVCLMSLDHADAVPVDTHVHQIAMRDYRELAHLRAARSLTPRAYTEIADFFRARFGSHAGWAHTVLFANDLGPRAWTAGAAGAAVTVVSHARERAPEDGHTAGGTGVMAEKRRRTKGKGATAAAVGPAIAALDDPMAPTDARSASAALEPLPAMARGRKRLAVG